MRQWQVSAPAAIGPAAGQGLVAAEDGWLLAGDVHMQPSTLQHSQPVGCNRRSAPLPHQADLEAQGQHKGGQQAAHPHVVSPRALALRRAVHRHKPDDEQDAPHLGEGGEVEAGREGGQQMMRRAVTPRKGCRQVAGGRC